MKSDRIIRNRIIRAIYDVRKYILFCDNEANFFKKFCPVNVPDFKIFKDKVVVYYGDFEFFLYYKDYDTKVVSQIDIGGETYNIPIIENVKDINEIMIRFKYNYVENCYDDENLINSFNEMIAEVKKHVKSSKK